MKYEIEHITDYTYGHATSLGYNEAWISPRSLPYQEVLSSDIIIDPAPAVIKHRKDFFGNKRSFFMIQQAHQKLSIKAVSTIKREAPSYELELNFTHNSWESSKALLSTFHPELIEARSYVLPSPLVPISRRLAAYAESSFVPDRSHFNSIWDLTQRIYKDFEYNPDFTTVATPIHEAFEGRKGVCQDFAHIAIACIRSMGLSARYVSGYIETIPPEGEDALIGSAATHAWFSAYIPEMGWVDFDPTNNQVVKDQHITVAWGRDYSDVPPLKGVIFSSSDQQLSVAVNVKRLQDAK